MNDYGAGLSFRPRSARLEEAIEELIARDEKIRFEDWRGILQDVIDVIARDLTPRIVNISQRVAAEQFDEQERQDIEQMSAILEGWDGNYEIDSI